MRREDAVLLIAVLSALSSYLVWSIGCTAELIVDVSELGLGILAEEQWRPHERRSCRLVGKTKVEESAIVKVVL